ncbi:MAG: hypothetical protein JXR77_05925 [Lentisphaeria bacterium]|nr:hypothetical protein [Lentisphaeria bacterium]
MKRSGYVILSAFLSLLLHLLFLNLAERIRFRSFSFLPPAPERRVRVSLTNVSDLVMTKPRRPDLLREAEAHLREAVDRSPRIQQVFEHSDLALKPPAQRVRLTGLGDSILKPNIAEPPKAVMPTAPPPRILEIDGDALSMARQALDRRLQPRVARYDVPGHDLPSLLPPGPPQKGIGQTLDVSMRMGSLPGIPGLRPEDVAALGGQDEDGNGDPGRRFAPRGGIPGLRDLGESGALKRHEFGQDPLEMLDAFVTVSVVVHRERRGGGYFRVDIAPNPRSDSLRDVAKDILLVIDHSTSISPSKLEQFKASTVEALQYLNPKDRFDVISFTDSPRRCFGALVAVGPETLDKAQRYVEGLVRGGMTDVFGSLSPFVSSNNPDTLRPLNLFLMSDGNSTVNILKEDEFVRGIVGMNPGNVSIYSFSAGRRANLFLMQFLGYLNRGFSLHEEKLEDFRGSLVRYISTHSSLIVADLRYQAAGGLDDGMFPKRLPHLYRGETLSLFGRYQEGVEELTLSMLGRDGTGKQRELIFRRAFADCPEGGQELAQNWAAQKVFHLIGQRTLTTEEGHRAEINAEIAALAQRYALYVPY